MNNFTERKPFVSYLSKNEIRFAEKFASKHDLELITPRNLRISKTHKQVIWASAKNLALQDLAIKNSKPFAMCYAGHQFGNWAGQLGDGRAINLGEIKDWAIQLKGAGPTPYSRAADGLAVLRSSIREYLCSEAMHHLGVPSTRALALSLTGDQVLRDLLYDGNPAYESGAIVARVARSFLRFGNFELSAARNDLKNLTILTEYTINRHFPYGNACSARFQIG